LEAGFGYFEAKFTRKPNRFNKTVPKSAAVKTYPLF